MKILHIRVLAVIGAALVLMIGGAVAYAQIPSADGTISGCYVKSTGAIKIIDKDTTSCKKGETLLQWNQKGQPGTNGTNGTNGAPGTDGTNGVSGYVREEATGSASGVDVAGFGSYTAAILCGSGKKVVGGGGFASISSQGSRLADVLGTYTPNDRQWAVTFGPADGTVFGADDTINYTLTAVCATVTP